MKLLAYAVLLVTGGMGMTALYPAIRGPWESYAHVSLALLLIFLSVLIHELGHAAAVRFVKGDLQAIAVVPFELRLRPRRLSLVRRLRGREVGGYVTYAINRVGARRKHMIVALAGPGASLALAVLAAIGAEALATQSPVGAFCAGLALVSGGAGIANLLPFEGSDGAQILQRWRAGRLREKPE